MKMKDRMSLRCMGFAFHWYCSKKWYLARSFCPAHASKNIGVYDSWRNGVFHSCYTHTQSDYKISIYFFSVILFRKVTIHGFLLSKFKTCLYSKPCLKSIGKNIFYESLLYEFCRNNAGGEESKPFSSSFINKIITILTVIAGDSTRYAEQSWLSALSLKLLGWKRFFKLSAEEISLAVVNKPFTGGERVGQLSFKINLLY